MAVQSNSASRTNQRLVLWMENVAKAVVNAAGKAGFRFVATTRKVQQIVNTQDTGGKMFDLPAGTHPLHFALVWVPMVKEHVPYLVLDGMDYGTSIGFWIDSIWGVPDPEDRITLRLAWPKRSSRH